ncbi:MAG: cell division protein FtsL [SAR86 cluster bacterium]|jgi:cell division protein FtsB|uniref:Cell division protein FtsL n=1 Tax=SAR86 cluster bacterium TaxID=2030880 RepID=A0A937LJH6_9GAMM|nr:cell division protein FtsL [SAR86 cluster bacterium]
MSLNHLIILFTLILLLSFLGIEKIKLSFEINRLNTNQQNLLKEYETFKDKNLKLVTQSYTNNSPANIERQAKQDLGMIKKKAKKIYLNVNNEEK